MCGHAVRLISYTSALKIKQVKKITLENVIENIFDPILLSCHVITYEVPLLETLLVYLAMHIVYTVSIIYTRFICIFDFPVSKRQIKLLSSSFVRFVDPS